MQVRHSLVAQNYAAKKEAITPNPAQEGSLAGVAQSFAQTLQASEKFAMNTMQSNADPHTLVQALAQTELAVQTAVTVRNKVVEAYQEILRMPI